MSRPGSLRAGQRRRDRLRIASSAMAIREAGMAVTQSGTSGEIAAGVDFPVADDGRRSTSAFGRAVIADALRETDAAGALGAEQETNWRSGYLTHFRSIIEPSCADAVRAVADHPDWLSLPGRTVAVLGAGSEIGPLPVLLRWGVTVAGIDLPEPRIWERVLQAARSSAGTLLVPVTVPSGS